MNKLRNTLERVLKKESKFIDSETKEINYTAIKDAADSIDPILIELLADNKELRKEFFSKIKDIFVFNINDFKFFLDENRVNNSYTQYANKIGLASDGKLIKNSKNVVLEFPFKDCLLEGGQSSEEGEDTYFEYEEEKTKIVKGKKITQLAGYVEKQSKRKEIFFNQVLARDEIDRLFDKKALVDWKRFTKRGEEKVKEIRRGDDGVISENLIIKGNNLLALKSLESEFKGKVKLIYVDPPYYFKNSTQGDAFVYNSNFKLSTWLTFMKNRLEVAKLLLSENGVIFIQISDEGHAYLKILMDEIFGRECFVNNLIIKMSDLSGMKMAHIDKKFPKTKENILLYKKNKIKINKVYKAKDKWDSEYKRYIENFDLKDYQFIKNYSGEDLKEFNNKVRLMKLVNLNDKISELDVSGLNSEEKEETILNFCKKNSYRIIRTSNSSGLKNIVDKLPRTNQEIISVVSKNKSLNLCVTTYNKESKDPRIQIVFSKDNLETPLGDIWNDISTSGLHSEGGVILKGGKKPEKLIEYIINSCSNENDLILDYHLGSGTTCAVAHKMNRQYIGIEQMEYGKNDSVVRLNNVISGDQTGISKAVNWKGGGDFIYLKLAKWNEKAKDEIQNISSYEELVSFFSKMYKEYFLNYNVKIVDFKEKIIHEENFKSLSLDEQKRMFLTMLDLNQMYVLESEMKSEEFGISKEDQRLTEEFYNKK